MSGLWVSAVMVWLFAWAGGMVALEEAKAVPFWVTNRDDKRGITWCLWILSLSVIAPLVSVVGSIGVVVPTTIGWLVTKPSESSWLYRPLCWWNGHSKKAEIGKRGHCDWHCDRCGLDTGVE